MTITKVTDSRSNPEEQIVHAANILGKSAQRKKVFEAIYHGKQEAKTVQEISDKTHLTRKNVLNAGKVLSNNGLVAQTKKNSDTAYKKDAFYQGHKTRIVKLAGNREAISKIPTKRNPMPTHIIRQIIAPRQSVRITHITIDDIDSFSKAHRLSHSARKITPLSEQKFKDGIKSIINERGQFKDWGGESNDLFTTRIRIKKHRMPTALAFKGKATRGKLTPRKMGKNGDQIQRLFTSSAKVFLVQYWYQIDESVVRQMQAFATEKSIQANSEILFGIIDGQDSQRLIKAYPRAFS